VKKGPEITACIWIKKEGRGVTCFGGAGARPSERKARRGRKKSSFLGARPWQEKKKEPVGGGLPYCQRAKQGKKRTRDVAKQKTNHLVKGARILGGGEKSLSK